MGAVYLGLHLMLSRAADHNFVRSGGGGPGGQTTGKPGANNRAIKPQPGTEGVRGRRAALVLDADGDVLPLTGP